MHATTKQARCTPSRARTYKLQAPGSHSKKHGATQQQRFVCLHHAPYATQILVWTCAQVRRRVPPPSPHMKMEPCHPCTSAQNEQMNVGKRHGGHGQCHTPPNACPKGKVPKPATGGKRAASSSFTASSRRPHPARLPTLPYTHYVEHQGTPLGARGPRYKGGFSILQGHWKCFMNTNLGGAGMQHGRRGRRAQGMVCAPSAAAAPTSLALTTPTCPTAACASPGGWQARAAAPRRSCQSCQSWRCPRGCGSCGAGRAGQVGEGQRGAAPTTAHTLPSAVSPCWRKQPGGMPRPRARSPPNTHSCTALHRMLTWAGWAPRACAAPAPPSPGAQTSGACGWRRCPPGPCPGASQG